MKTMVIVAHPGLEASRVNRTFMLEIQNHANIDVRDLYSIYPDWNIDVEKEQQLLLLYDRIIFQFPFCWYSCPPLLKKWFDDVFTYGWAFGPEGNHLKGKEFMLATTTGGPEHGYQAGGDNCFTISEFFRPIQRTVTKCNGTYLPAFVTYNTTHGTDAYFAQEAKRYAEYIQISSSLLVH
ncbi:NAD(P)H-dependent oxidoreductase [Paenibacillus sp. P96]|uniref:NAD(P)H-dependent oxidoreductase n=1 Tax=Paenibacillus zeirhizosphaerae TaxID=2987519 RepID=A0ABT9FRA3_9BACL|nr:NAD(P)H-dependent oxidoreductase [Paenibacillus sp. P96]MDP4097268.1 NAD(P)H-dependent oxidoreductase [Paenibacillus sp. P96]